MKDRYQVGKWAIISKTKSGVAHRFVNGRSVCGKWTLDKDPVWWDKFGNLCSRCRRKKNA